MQYTILGKTGYKISRIGYGGWGIAGGTPDTRWSSIFWKANDQESKKALLLAYEQGVNFFDTAWIYAKGHSERLIAETLKGKNIIIATKVPPKDRLWPARNKNIEEVYPIEWVLKRARESYQNLGRTIDLLQLHVWLDDWFSSSLWRQAFAQLRKEKIAKHFGISVNDHDPDSALKIAASGEVDSIQVIYNIFDQAPRDKLFKLARKSNTGIIARVPLDEGSLSGSFSLQTTFHDWRKDYFTPPRLKTVVEKVTAMKNTLVRDNRTMVQISLKYCLLSDGADVAIAGMRNSKHVSENCKSPDITLNESEISYLNSQRWIRNFYPVGI